MIVCVLRQIVYRDAPNDRVNPLFRQRNASGVSSNFLEAGTASKKKTPFHADIPEIYRFVLNHLTPDERRFPTSTACDVVHEEPSILV